jgi:putative peptide zinc metalloprotease protein
MSSATGLLQARPRVRPGILISQPLLRGPALVHLLQDPETGAQVEVGAKLQFVIARLDGVRTLNEIGDEYAARFEARLGERQWHQLLQLLHGRQLLTGTAPRAAPERTGQPRPTLLEGRIRLASGTPALIERLHGVTGFSRRPFFLASLLLLQAVLLAALATRLGALVRDTAELRRQPVALLVVCSTVWVSMGLHELAHGVAGRAAGGTVTEIGLRWRLPVAFLYCQVEDIRFLPCRWRQVATAGAGVIMNLALLLPVYPVWALLPESAQARPALGGLLLIGAGAGLVNLLPLPPMDGYKILEYLLGTVGLSVESRRFAALAASRLIRRGTGVGAYPARSRLVHGGYAVGWTVLTGLLLLALGALCRNLLGG